MCRICNLFHRFTSATTISHTLCYQTPFGVPIEQIYDGVHDGAVLGSGVSGVVRLVVHKNTGVKYAVKCLDIGLVDSMEGLRQLRNEIFIMTQVCAVLDSCFFSFSFATSLLTVA